MAIHADKIVKQIGTPSTSIIQGISLDIADGDFISISGRSGSGKSTLLYLLSTLDKPSDGSLVIDGRDPQSLSVDALHKFRNESVGFVFQFHYLLPELSAIENVLLPARKTHQLEVRREYAEEMFDTFDIANKTDKRPVELSGGEQQRVAIARALIMQPRYLFADEPTGNLDSRNGRIVMDILQQVNAEQNTTLVLVTHEEDYAKLASREIFLVDGRIVDSRESAL